MKCPSCNIDLVMAERSGIEIDYCLQCRGVWLDRGELDKIIERNAQATTPPQDSGFGTRVDYRLDKEEKRYRDDDYYDPRKKNKRKSLLDDLFDF